MHAVVALALVTFALGAPSPQRTGLEFFGSLLPTAQPKNITADELIITLYTRANPKGQVLKTGDVEALLASTYKPGDTKFTTHGYMSSGTASSVQNPKNEFLKVEDVNVFGVDWSACARNLLYEQTAQCTVSVGQHLADFIKFLEKEGGLILDNVHLVGHSLGAHVMSHTATALGNRVSRISAMDPAAPLFAHLAEVDRLHPGNAKFVDVMHTYITFLGMEIPLGHVDAYPNGGTAQPGCSLLQASCNHEMSITYFVDSILNPYKYMAYKCESVEAAKAQNCSGALAPMGYKSTEAEPGIYWFNATEIIGAKGFKKNWQL